MKEYKVGEIFKLNDVVYQCVEADREEQCTICAFIDDNCKDIACWDTGRSAHKYVYFTRVAEPEEGMLFRTSDGVLYELRDMTKIPIKEIYNCGCVKGSLPCAVIDDEAFGKSTGALLHWYPVDEQKMVVKYTKGE